MWRQNLSLVDFLSNYIDDFDDDNLKLLLFNFFKHIYLDAVFTGTLLHFLAHYHLHISVTGVNL